MSQNIASSLHHSFDINLASEFGIEEAILIHHFQHWISVNKRLKRNFKQERTWSYQTYAEIAAHFPYLSYDKVRRALEKLCKMKVLLKGKFNQRSGDNTVWFAFFNENLYIKIEEKTPSAKPMPDSVSEDFPRAWQNCQGSGKNARALPDTKPDTKTRNTKYNPPPTSSCGDRSSSSEEDVLPNDDEMLKCKIASEWKKKGRADEHFKEAWEIYEDRPPGDVRSPHKWFEKVYKNNILGSQFMKELIERRIRLCNRDKLGDIYHDHVVVLTDEKPKKIYFHKDEYFWKSLKIGIKDFKAFKKHMKEKPCEEKKVKDSKSMQENLIGALGATMQKMQEDEELKREWGTG